MAELSNCYRDRPTKLKAFASVVVWEISCCVPDVAVHRAAQSSHWPLKAEETLLEAIFLMAQWAASRRWMPSSVHRCVVCSHLKEEEPVTPISFSACLWPPNLRITHYRGSLDLPKSSLLRTSLLLRGSQTRYGCLLIFKCSVDLWMVSFCKAASWTRDCSLSPAVSYHIAC